MGCCSTTRDQGSEIHDFVIATMVVVAVLVVVLMVLVVLVAVLVVVG